MLELAVAVLMLHAPQADEADPEVVLGDDRQLTERGGWLKPSVEPGAGFRRDFTFRPWSPFYILRRGELGTWSLLGTTFAGCLDRVDMPCEDRAEAGFALAWQPRNSFVSFFGGVAMSGHGRQAAMNRATGVSVIGGVLLTPPALIDLLKRRAR